MLPYKNELCLGEGIMPSRTCKQLARKRARGYLRREVKPNRKKERICKETCRYMIAEVVLPRMLRIRRVERTLNMQCLNFI